MDGQTDGPDGLNQSYSCLVAANNRMEEISSVPPISRVQREQFPLLQVNTFLLISFTKIISLEYFWYIYTIKSDFIFDNNWLS